MTKLLFTLLAAMTVTPVALAGDWIGSGTGLRSYENNPWFLGKPGISRSVSYCLSVGSGFPLSERQVAEEVSRALTSWESVSRRYNFHRKTFQLKFPDGEDRNLNIKYVKEDCQLSTQLKFFVGDDHPSIQHLIERMPEKTYAFAILQEPDFPGYTANAQGVIWIQSPHLDRNGEKFPPYHELAEGVVGNNPYLRTVLLHEIGHTFGLGHYSDHSNMTEHLIEWMALRNDSGWRTGDFLAMLNQLDRYMWLFPFARPSIFQPRSHAGKEELFHLVSGRKPGIDEAYEVTINMGEAGLPGEHIAANISVVRPGGTDTAGLTLRLHNPNEWPKCKIKVIWPGASTTQTNVMTQGCLDPVMSGDSLAGSAIINGVFYKVALTPEKMGSKYDLIFYRSGHEPIGATVELAADQGREF